MIAYDEAMRCIEEGRCQGASTAKYRRVQLHNKRYEAPDLWFLSYQQKYRGQRGKGTWNFLYDIACYEPVTGKWYTGQREPVVTKHSQSTNWPARMRKAGWKNVTHLDARQWQALVEAGYNGLVKLRLMGVA